MRESLEFQLANICKKNFKKYKTIHFKFLKMTNSLMKQPDPM